MSNLLIILAVLLITLIVVVKLAEKFAKPMDNEQMSKLSRWAMILMMVLLVGNLLRHLMGG